MPFFYKPYKKIQCTLQDRCINNNNGAQAIRKTIYQINKIIRKALRKKRVLRSVSFSALMTVEAAVVLPLFLLAVFILLSVMHMLGIHLNLLTEAVQSIHKAAVYTYSDDYDLDRILMEFILGIGRSDVDFSHIDGGMAGIDYWGTDYDKETGEIKLCMTYKVNPVIDFFGINGTKMTVSLHSRAFVGGKWFGGNSTSYEDNETIVYVAQNGVVYHSSRECAYIDLSVHGVPATEISVLRNNQGGKYYSCELCSCTEDAPVVYVTDTGNRYHCSAKCSGISRDVYEMIWQPDCVLPPCSRCGK